MGPLADELGVSRVTLNRWVGSRDKLLGEVNWSLAEISLRDARAQAGGSGADAVADTVEVFARTVLAADFMQAFLNRETDIALRILTTSRSDLQENVIGFIEQLLRRGAQQPAGIARLRGPGIPRRPHQRILYLRGHDHRRTA